MNEHYYAVIMAGGGGTRLWPLSRQTRPKQVLSLFNENSLFQTTVNRLEGQFAPENILVVTVATQAHMLQEQVPDIPPANYLLEPMPKGTASVVGLAAIELLQRDPQAVMAVLTADHYIGNVPRFQQLLQAAYTFACQDHLVTLGISPTFPSTGFGYIQRGLLVGSSQGFSAYQVKRFKEKPDDLQAQAMLASGDHDWNSGMFIWRAAQIMSEFESQMPELAAGLRQIDQARGSTQHASTLQEVWSALQSVPIDYGVMEHAQDVVVIPATDLAWNDVGSWDALFDVLPVDAQGNILMDGNHVELGTTNSLVYIEDSQRLIVTIGIDDLVIVETGDVLLVCKKADAQKVRDIVTLLKKTKPEYV
jgi:mannose-1-phosphate guanylyltransferase